MTPERIEFSRPAGELSCIVGNLFAELKPTGGLCAGADAIITVFGQTHSGKKAVLRVLRDRCVYTGPREDLEAVLNGSWPERWRCGTG